MIRPICFEVHQHGQRSFHVCMGEAETVANGLNYLEPGSAVIVTVAGWPKAGEGTV